MLGISLLAIDEAIKKEIYYGVSAEIDKNNNKFFNTLNEIEDQETKKTIYQYSHSIFNIKVSSFTTLYHPKNHILKLTW